MRGYKESTTESISHVGFQESMAPMRFRPKKAAVLICLFEGDDGDLRVILTKRSSTLSTHSGLYFSFRNLGLLSLIEINHKLEH